MRCFLIGMSVKTTGAFFPMSCFVKLEESEIFGLAVIEPKCREFVKSVSVGLEFGAVISFSEFKSEDEALHFF